MASMQSPDISLIHFILRLLIAVGSFLSTIFKVPFIIYAVEFVIDFLMKQQENKSSSSSVQPDSESKQLDLPTVELALNVILLVSLFIAVLVVLIRAVYTICLGRLINVYSYLIIMGLWITFILIATMTDGWKGPLNYAILGARILLVGWFAVKAPSTWHFILLRASLIIDIISYPAMIGLAILNIKYNFLKDRKIGVWTRYNNLIRTL
ncbi:uncharacterized protein LOC107367094 [Tetranychus urticae]|uniref:Uncharacterized protein n=1 Tax=Tetranychus urticae TaxID=32264 RepID=T1KT43_TETUR|nr:uncharacterized protein LOC107367094 [Tetranychus urticae]